jgi:EAL and modified HD-GYP domain-containing signal transduction protein
MSLDHPVLDQVVLAASTLFDEKREALAVRLTVSPQRPNGPVDAEGALALVGEIAPAGSGPIVLGITDETALRSLASAELPTNLLLEVPGFLLSDAALVAALEERAAAGQPLVVRGRVPEDAPQALWALFQYVVVDRANVRTPLPNGFAGKPLLRIFEGADGPAMAGAALRAGFTAVQGWAIGEAPTAETKAKNVPAGVATVVDLMQRVDREEPAEKLESVIRIDPSLAFRLMRYLNSPGFGLSVEISSFRHALMILGYQRLKRWLALLVTSAIDDPDLKPLMHLAVRRGLLMEELGRSGDDTLRNELFICGVFSLLDRMLGQPFERLLKTIPVPASVQQALVDESGPCAPFLAIAIAVEQESLYDIRANAESLLLSLGDVNRALVKALVNARSLTSA